MKRLREGQQVTFKLDRARNDYSLEMRFGGFAVQANVGGKFLLGMADRILSVVDEPDEPGGK